MPGGGHACLGGVHVGGVHAWGASMARGHAWPVGEMATVAGGTHPTGMHSC